MIRLFSTIQEHPFRLTMTPDAPQLRFATRDMDGRPPLLLSVQRENADLWELPSSSAQGEVRSPVTNSTAASSTPQVPYHMDWHLQYTHGMGP